MNPKPPIVMKNDKTLSVGINLTFLGECAGGNGRYVQELIPALLNVAPNIELHAFVGSKVLRKLMDEPWASLVHWINLHLEPTGMVGHRLAQMIIMPALAITNRLDVFHNPAIFGPVRIPGRPTIITLFELRLLRYNEKQRENELERQKMKKAMIRCAKQADRIITSSKSVAEDLTETLGVNPDRIDRIPLGVRKPHIDNPTPEDVLRKKHGLKPGPIILSIAQKQAYKNLACLVKALSDIDEMSVQLVLPGEHTPYEMELKRLANELHVIDRISFPDWVSEEDLEGFYCAAGCMVLPSFIEGFGLPVLEAMARGVPVACSNRWALPEVAGDAALLFDPDDQSQVTHSIKKLLFEHNFAAHLVEKGYTRAREFSWQKTALMTLASYRRAIKDHPSKWKENTLK